VRSWLSSATWHPQSDTICTSYRNTDRQFLHKSSERDDSWQLEPRCPLRSAGFLYFSGCSTTTLWQRASRTVKLCFVFGYSHTPCIKLVFICSFIIVSGHSQIFWRFVKKSFCTAWGLCCRFFLHPSFHVGLCLQHRNSRCLWFVYHRMFYSRWCFVCGCEWILLDWFHCDMAYCNRRCSGFGRCHRRFDGFDYFCYSFLFRLSSTTCMCFPFLCVNGVAEEVFSIFSMQFSFTKSLRNWHH